MADAIDLEELKSQAKKCIEDLSNGGPATKRFCEELTKLLSDIETSKSNCHTAQHEIENMNDRLLVVTEKTKRAVISVQESDEKIASLRSEIEKTNEISNQTEESIDAMKVEVRIGC